MRDFPFAADYIILKDSYRACSYWIGSREITRLQEAVFPISPRPFWLRWKKYKASELVTMVILRADGRDFLITNCDITQFLLEMKLCKGITSED